MIVKIGKYVHWYTTTRAEDAYLRWRHKKHPWEVNDSDHDWIDRTVMSLLDVWQNVLHSTINQIQSRRKQKIRVKLDPWDTWNADYTLALIILPVLKQLRDTSHSHGMVDSKDAPKKLRPSKKENEEIQKTGTMDSKAQARWNYVLGEMIFAFESIVDDSWSDQFFTFTDEYATMYDKTGFDKYNERINNGLRLFGKYYRSLWD